jgi:hypothetical protein
MTGAIAKEGKRIIDPEVLRWVVHERDRVCLYGLFYSDPCQFGLDPHHIEKRSELGDDIPENLITLCRKHHDQAEENTIPKEHLQGILNALYGYGG